MISDSCTPLGDSCNFEKAKRIYMTQHAFYNSFEGAAETFPMKLEALGFTNFTQLEALL